MSRDRFRGVTSPKGGNVFEGLSKQAKLILRLLVDGRVNPLLKILPIGSLLYLLIPDLAPGPIDDALIIWLGTSLFVELCPPAVVQEHLDSLTNPVGSSEQEQISDEDIIDAEYWEDDQEHKA